MAWRHGTKYGYSDKGCRCTPCTEAANAIRRGCRVRGRAKQSPAYLRELAQSRALKESYRGTCEDCGRRTTGCDGPHAAPKLCNHCAPKYNNLRLRGRGPVTEAALAYMAEPRRFMDVAAHLGITAGHTGVLLHRLRGYGLIERLSRGVYQRVEKEAKAA